MTTKADDATTVEVVDEKGAEPFQTRTKAGTFAPGSPRSPNAGRKKGVPNRSTRAIRDMVMGALDDAGGQRYLAEQAKANPVAFLGLLRATMPKDVVVDAGATLEALLEASWTALPPERAQRIIDAEVIVQAGVAAAIEDEQLDELDEEHGCPDADGEGAAD